MDGAPGTVAARWLPITGAGLALRKDRILVLVWNAHYFGEGYHRLDEVLHLGGRSLRCEFTADRGRIEDADALWFHVPTLRSLPESKRRGQRWVLMSMESEANYPLLRDERFMRLFDLHMTYRLDSDVPVPYLSWREYGTFRGPTLPPERKAEAGAPAVYVQSNPVPRRDAFVRELMRHLDVHAFGRCLNNRRFEGALPGEGRGPNLALLGRYKFWLAFENSSATDYVTERLFRALAAGTVPVYWGAPNVREFLPSPQAAILVDAFAGPRQLAEHLRALDRDDAAYEAHLAWRGDEFLPSFRRIGDMSELDARLRLCIKLAHGCSRDCACGGRLRRGG